ncbi:type II toxin-antitoxin system YafQ family toxin [Helicobacter jaachi]|uniref:type II toxin-antitoxin system YafQ family toxin n=1 Tax=Helicobacter jaachi TaxID=1677920 RepID=UPI0008518762|nr:type II toxin-antitoxin system YafQ family toxin [Helicobacter jaachi]
MYKVRISNSDKNLVDNVIDKLAQGKILEAQYKNHKLKGEYKNCEECHIKPDLLLIYKKHEDILVLVCIALGSHSDLF